MRVERLGPEADRPRLWHVGAVAVVSLLVGFGLVAWSMSERIDRGTLDIFRETEATADPPEAATRPQARSGRVTPGRRRQRPAASERPGAPAPRVAAAHPEHQPAVGAPSPEPPLQMPADGTEPPPLVPAASPEPRTPTDNTEPQLGVAAPSLEPTPAAAAPSAGPTPQLAGDSPGPPRLGPAERPAPAPPAGPSQTAATPATPPDAEEFPATRPAPAALRIRLGRTAYIRCDGAQPQGGRFPCPRDAALERRVRESLTALLSCATAPQTVGEADARLYFARRGLTNIYMFQRRRGRPLLDSDQVLSCLRPAFAGITTRIDAVQLVVSFRFAIEAAAPAERTDSSALQTGRRTNASTP